MIESKLATLSDVAAYYGKAPRETIQAYIVLKDQEPAGIIGIARRKTHSVMFSEFKTELRDDLRCMTILKTIKKALQFVKDSRVPVYTMSTNTEPASPRIIERLGFRYVKTLPTGEVFQWQR